MKKSGIILEGGGTRGVFTSGVLDYFMEKGLYFPYVIGVSAGACNAVGYASKQPYRTRKCMIDYLYSDSYLSIKNMLLNKGLFDMDLIFDKFPNDLIPFDYDTFFSKEIRCIITVTNCITGKAEYLEEYEDKKRLMDICKASSSLPYISPIIEIDGTPYLDGGLADSVLVYRDYPNLNETIYKRNARYNRMMEFIEHLEEKGHVIVLRPEMPAIDRAEQNTDVLMDFYQHGYEIAEKYYDSIIEFIK